MTASWRVLSTSRGEPPPTVTVRRGGHHGVPPAVSLNVASQSLGLRGGGSVVKTAPSSSSRRAGWSAQLSRHGRPRESSRRIVVADAGTRGALICRCSGSERARRLHVLGALSLCESARLAATHVVASPVRRVHDLYMDAPMENLRALCKQLEGLGWVVACFPFVYKKHKYFVLVERYVPPATPPQYYLVHITFVDSRDTSRTLSGPANTHGIDVGVKGVREFFGIEWRENPRELMLQFYEHFGKFVPPEVPLKLESEEQEVAIRHLDKGDSEDPRKKYCFAVRRNGRRADGDAGRRSPFNSQKTYMYRPELYNYFKNDENISFIYSVNPEDEQTDEQILDRFAAK